MVLVLGQVVLTEPLRFRLGHPMDHSNAAGSPRRFAPGDANRSRSRMSIDGICVQVRGNVVRSFSCEKLNLADFDERRRHFCISRVRNVVAPNKKRASRRFKFCWEVIAARIRSLNPVGLGTGTRIPVSHRKPLLGHSRAFERGLDL